MRPTISLAVIALLGGLLTIGAIDDHPAEAIAAPIAHPNPLAADVAALSERQHEHHKLIESLLLRAACDCNDEPAPEPEPEQQLAVITTAAVCTSGSCSQASVSSSRTSTRPRLFSGRVFSGRLFSGRILGRLFGRRR